MEISYASLNIPSYGLGKPEKNPLFFEKRVYQGSSGKVYPVPFIDKVEDEAKPCSYQAVTIENEYLRLTMLPEIGGRIFLGQDKVNQDYDFFYRQDVIKPALVGLAGPWISGGVEFNWPQHHRPGTYMPCDVHIEDAEGEVRTVWFSEHDPINRLKGMHGICVHPNSNLIELKARMFNRTPFKQTFLWWANVAAKVHDNYQSFFPPDVHYVADHAVRAISSFPHAENDYYGVDYAARPGANDLTWYKNIEVPTSYMVCDTRFNFFGGYDYDAEGGFIHVADRHIAPGKKQWTWGNHEFGWAWDRELTDENGPYVELMAGVYTDNQPDFSYLEPYETKTFSQYWWPYKKIGPVQNASKDVAIRLVVDHAGMIEAGVVSSRPLEGLHVQVAHNEVMLIDEVVDIDPDTPWYRKNIPFPGGDEEKLSLKVKGYLSYQYSSDVTERTQREVATEPPIPSAIEHNEELYLTAEHLEQYRHPTRYAEAYWDELLSRDPKDARANIAYGRKHLANGRLAEATECLSVAIQRLTHLHPNPETGEAHYYLGVVKRFQALHEEAYALFYKATWNYAFRAAAYYELAMLDAKQGDYTKAVVHCDAALVTNQQHNKAIILKALCLKKLGLNYEDELKALLKIDPLDHWARHALGDVDGFLTKSRNDAQTILDIAYDYVDGGFVEEAISLLKLHHKHEVTQVAVPNPLEKSQLTHYLLAYLSQAPKQLEAARLLSSDYFFPSRIHDQLVLEWALTQSVEDVNAAYALGNYYYDRKRHEEAIACWESVTPFSSLSRNLGVAYWNIRKDAQAARKFYEQAIVQDPKDARIFAEYDQLREKLGDKAEDRLQDLLAKRELVDQRDDASVSLATLYNDTQQFDKALALLQERRFHPWEGGEGKVLRQYTRAHLLLTEQALEAGDAETAWEHAEAALKAPENVGEAYHLLQAKADVLYWQGKALKALGRDEEAQTCFESAANEQGDFTAMEVTEHSHLSYYRGLALKELGQEADACSLFEELKSYALREMNIEAKIDYFATSLPLLLVFEDDLTKLKNEEAQELLALAKKGLEAVS